MSASTNRDWKVEPYGVEDAALFGEWEIELLDELRAKRGVGIILWDKDSFTDGTLEWHRKICEVVTPRALHKEDDVLDASVNPQTLWAQDETEQELERERTAFAQDVAEHFYQHKLRDFTTDSRAKAFKKLESVAAMIEEERFNLYFLLKSWTTGTVREEVIQLGSKDVEQVRPRIAELFGKQTFDDAEDLLKQLKNGIVATRIGSDGSIQYIPMKNRDNVVTWFKGLEKLRTEVLKRQDKESRKDFEPCQWPQMVLHASKRSKDHKVKRTLRCVAVQITRSKRPQGQTGKIV